MKSTLHSLVFLYSTSQKLGLDIRLVLYAVSISSSTNEESDAQFGMWAHGAIRS